MEAFAGSGLQKFHHKVPGINRRKVYRLLIFLSIALLAVDTVYKSYYGITYLTREECLLYRYLPRWGFLMYEYFVELLIIVLVGIFAAALLERYFVKLKRFVPGNSVTAFLYASVIPLCSCGAVPLVRAMDRRIPFRVVMTFIIAAPLLNPYIMVLSASVLGYKYLILRVLCSGVLAISTGYVAGSFYKRSEHLKTGIFESCSAVNGCAKPVVDSYESTFLTFKKILPYLLAAGILGISMELYLPKEILKYYDLSNNIIGTALVILIGVPVYFCNGADVLFLQPLVLYGNLPAGTAMAFSLTSTSVCVTSLVLLFKFIGKKLTFIVLGCVVILTFFIGFLINLLPSFI